MLIIIFCISCALPASATETASEIEFVIHPQENYLPAGGAESFHTEHTGNESTSPTDASVTSTQYHTVYGFEYIKGPLFYGDWRNGASACSTLTSITLNFDNGYDETYNTSFTATVTGEYTLSKKAKIDGALGVELGKSDTYSFGSGITVTVPKGSHYIIRYRPVYYKYKVIETKYLRAYIDWVGWDEHVISTKICYVDVFSHWDYTVVEYDMI